LYSTVPTVSPSPTFVEPSKGPISTPIQTSPPASSATPIQISTPVPTRPTGFLGTGLPLEYVIIAALLVTAAAAGISLVYLKKHRKWRQQFTKNLYPVPNNLTHRGRIMEFLTIYYLILAVQVAILFACFWLSIRSPLKRRTFGEVLLILGIVEIVTFLSVNLINLQLNSAYGISYSNTISYVLDFTMVAIGFVTLIVGAIQATHYPRLNSAKTK
jgi:hypothetical protein